jgi:hypothetical protein
MIILVIGLVSVYSCFGKRTRNKICKALVSVISAPIKLLSK